MSKNSWERAFGAMAGNGQSGYSNSENELSEMRLKQRQIQQEGWDKELAEAKTRANAQTADEQVFDESATWAEAYKDTNNTLEENVEVAELTPIEHIIQALENDNMFHKEHGAIGSVKMLINRYKVLDQQLTSIKASFGQM